MINAMIGRELASMYPPRTGSPGADLVLSAASLGQPGVLHDVSFEVRAGEILGLFGLMGSGRSELARILFGLDPHATGRIELAGRPPAAGARGRIRDGLAFVTENRREEGLMMEASIAANLSLVSIRDFGRTPAALIDAAGPPGPHRESSGTISPSRPPTSPASRPSRSPAATSRRW